MYEDEIICQERSGQVLTNTNIGGSLFKEAYLISHKLEIFSVHPKSNCTSVLVLETLKAVCHKSKITSKHFPNCFIMVQYASFLDGLKQFPVSDNSDRLVKG